MQNFMEKFEDTHVLEILPPVFFSILFLKYYSNFENLQILKYYFNSFYNNY